MAESWAPDGTREPAPLPPAPDPLAGLVTGEFYAPEPFTFKVAKPSMPDMTEVRKAVDAALSEEEEAEAATEEAPPARRPPARPATALATATPGMVAPNPRPGWPGAVVRRLPRVPSGGQRPAPPAARAALQRGRRAPSAGVGGVVVLIIVIIVILWIVINSLVETISDLLD